MSTWPQIKAAVGSQYGAHTDTGDTLLVEIDTERGRTQVVELKLYTFAQDEYLQITSPVAAVDELSHEQVVLALGAMSAVTGGGGLAVYPYGDPAVRKLAVVHETLIRGFNADDLASTLSAVAISADLLEKHLTGGDEH